MKTAIRIFALLIAIAGLASASFAPAHTQASSTRATTTAFDPGPQPQTPGPLPCELTNSCQSSVASR